MERLSQLSKALHKEGWKENEVLSRKLVGKMEKEVSLPDVYRAKLRPHYLSISSASACSWWVAGFRGKRNFMDVHFLEPSGCSLFQTRTVFWWL